MLVDSNIIAVFLVGSSSTMSMELIGNKFLPDDNISQKYLNLYVFPLELIFTRGQFWPSGIVVGCVCLSVRLCVR